MAAPDLTGYFDSIKAIREGLMHLGKWSPNKPYSPSQDEALQKYYDQTVIAERKDQTSSQITKEAADAKTNAYYNDTVKKERDSKQQPTANFVQNQVLNRAGIIAKNGALTLLWRAIEQKAKKVSDLNIKNYYTKVANTGKTLKEKEVGAKQKSDKDIKGYYDENLAGDVATIAKLRNTQLNKAGGDLAEYDKNRKAAGISDGEPVDKTNAEFPYRNTEDSIIAPGKTFVDANPDKMVQFKKLSGAENIEDLHKKNAEQGEKVKLFGQERNTNQFKNQITGFGTFPTPGEDIDAHDKIGETLLGSELVFKIGATALDPIPQVMYKSWAPAKRTNESNIGKPTTINNPASAQNEAMSQKINDLLKQQDLTIGSYKFFIEKLHGRHSGDQGSKQPYKKNPVKSRAGELIPAELGNRMVFPAYINAYNDSYDSNWESYEFIGRGEPFWAWKSTTRTFQLDFYMMSDVSTQLLTAAAKAVEQEQAKKGGKTNGKDPGGALNNTVNLARTSHDVKSVKNGIIHDAAGNAIDELEIADKDKFQSILDLFPDWGLGTTPISSYTDKGRKGFVQGEISGTPDQLWERATFLSQCVYGWYRSDGKLKEQPVVRIRISDFFDVTAIITSLNFTNEEFDIDLNLSATVGAIPTGIKVTMNCTILHEDEPNSEYRKFYHRKDRDNPSESDQHLAETAGPTGDAELNHSQSKSPIQGVAKNLAGRGPNAFPAEAAVYQAGLKNLSKSLSDLKVGGGTLQDAAKKSKLAQALKAGLRFLKLQQAYSSLQLPATKEEIDAAKGSMANKPIPKTDKLFGDKKPNNVPNVPSPSGGS